jgi:hypothetical protein
MNWKLLALATACVLQAACAKQKEYCKTVDSDSDVVDSGAVDDPCESTFRWKELRESETEATQKFWDAFIAGRYEDIDQVIEALNAELAADPDHPWVNHIRWRVNLWKLAEATRDVDMSHQDLPILVAETQSLLERSWELNPGDNRNYCFHGSMLLAVGREMQDEELIAQGIAEVELARELVPTYAGACAVMAYSNEPIGSETFQWAVDNTWSVMDRNFGQPLDRDDPDVSELMECESFQVIDACLGESDFPYLWEGEWLRAGDVLLKSGNLTAARRMYQNGMLRNYDTWPLNPILDERIAGIAERSALYEDETISNDPETGEPDHQCGMCHAD